MAGSVVVPDFEMMLMEKSLPSSSSHSSCHARVDRLLPAKKTCGSESLQVVVLALDQLNGSARAEVRAADADDDEHVGIRTDALRGAADALQLLRLLKRGQLQPAEEIIAGTAALGQRLVRGEDLLLRGEQIGQDRSPQTFERSTFNMDTMLLCSVSPPYVIAKQPKTQVTSEKNCRSSRKKCCGSV